MKYGFIPVKTEGQLHITKEKTGTGEIKRGEAPARKLKVHMAFNGGRKESLKGAEEEKRNSDAREGLTPKKKKKAKPSCSDQSAPTNDWGGGFREKKFEKEKMWSLRRLATKGDAKSKKERGREILRTEKE